MLSRKHRVRTRFFTLRRRPSVVVEGDGFTVKTFKQEKKVQVAVVVPKKVSPKAVVRNTIKRKVFNVFEKHIQDLKKAVYVVYIQKNLENLNLDIEEMLKNNFLDK